MTKQSTSQLKYLVLASLHNEDEIVIGGSLGIGTNFKNSFICVDKKPRAAGSLKFNRCSLMILTDS